MINLIFGIIWIMVGSLLLVGGIWEVAQEKKPPATMFITDLPSGTYFLDMDSEKATVSQNGRIWKTYIAERSKFASGATK